MMRILAFALFLALAGCASLPGPAQSVTHYVLNPSASAGRVDHGHPGTLLLREMAASAFYQTTGLVYSRKPDTRAHYQFAAWTELPSLRLTWLLRQHLEAAGAFAAVAPLASGVVGDYQLNTRLLDFYHDAATKPGVVHLNVEADLVDRAQGKLVAHRVFAVQAPVASYDAAGAAEAMNQAAGELIDEITVWLTQTSG